MRSGDIEKPVQSIFFSRGYHENLYILVCGKYYTTVCWCVNESQPWFILNGLHFSSVTLKNWVARKTCKCTFDVVCFWNALSFFWRQIGECVVGKCGWGGDSWVKLINKTDKLTWKKWTTVLPSAYLQS